MTTTATDTSTTLRRDTNQALGLGAYAVDFLRGDTAAPSASVTDRTVLFFTDSMLCLGATRCHSQRLSILLADYMRRESLTSARTMGCMP